ncbi:MAG TPA: hypothetical protein VIH99_07040 [Bdellovibrionota bacterium]|jgi:tetratricopeptide (TPR) repeat protein
MRIVPFLLFFFSLSLAGLSGCSQSPGTWWKSLNDKAGRLSQAEANYKALEHEHERLKKDYFRLENDYMELRAKVESSEAGERNLKATGSLTGRSPASISYEVPKGLRSEDMLVLAYEHFHEQRFPEAAVTFESFLKRPESAALADAYALYTAGVSWFQLGNFHKAREYFEEARNSASGEQREKINKKVDLWLRTIDRKTKGGGTLGG